MEAYRQKIRQDALNRKIRALFHFTNVVNLASIVAHGLIPRADLDKVGHPYTATDPYRLDGRPNTVSLSISDINYAMLATKRRDFPKANWVVLLLAPDVLWRKSCRFCERNAASKEMSSKHGTQSGPKSLTYLFYDDHGNDHGCFPARNDAEVLVYGQIEPSFIMGAWTDRQHIKSYVQNQLERISGQVLPTFTSPFNWPGLHGEK